MKSLTKSQRNTQCEVSYCTTACTYININGYSIRQTFVDEWFQNAKPSESRKKAIALYKKIIDYLSVHPQIYSGEEDSGDLNAFKEKHAFTSGSIVEVYCIKETTDEKHITILYKDTSKDLDADPLYSALIDEYELYEKFGFEMGEPLEHEDSDGKTHKYLPIELPLKSSKTA